MARPIEGPRTRVRRAKEPDRKPRPVNVFAAPLGRADAPLTRAQKESRKRTERAQQRLPKRPTPAIPVLANPTPRQTRAAKDLAGRAQRRAVGPGGSGKERLERQRAYQRELRQDPRQAVFVRALTRALEAESAADRRRTVSGFVKALERGRGKPLSRAERTLAQRQALTLRGRDRVRPGREHRRLGIGPASIDATALGRTVIGATTLGKSGSAETQFVKNALNDIKTLGTAPFIGGYELTAGVADVALGNGTDRLEALGKGVVEGAKESVPGQLVQGDLEGAVEAFRKNPLISALDMAAVGAVAGRTAGAVARGVGSTPDAGGLRGAAARAGSTVRPPLAMSSEPGGPIVERRGSKDIFRRGAQAGRDALREPLRREDGSVVTVMQRGQRVPVLMASPRAQERFQRRAADSDASRANALERMEREKAARGGGLRRTGAEGVRGRAARQVVAMVTDGTILTSKNFRQDLERTRDRIKGALAQPERFRDKLEVKRAEDNVAAIERVLASPKAMAQAEKVVAIGAEHGRRLTESERELQAAKLGLDPEQARRRRLMPVAINYMGARHVSVDEHQKLEKAALQQENRLRAQLAEAPKEQRPAIQAALKEARERRIAVSGRDPRKVIAHERLQAQARNARKRERALAAQIARVQRERARVQGAQAVTRGQDSRKGPVRVYRVGDRRFDTRAEAEAWRKANGGGQVQVLARTAREARRSGELARIDRNLAGLKKERAAALKDARTLEQKARESKLPPIQAALRRDDGTFLSTDDIEKFVREQGRDPDTIAYLPQSPVRPNAYHSQFRPGTRGDVGRVSTTGELYRRGAVLTSPEVLQEAGVRNAVMIAKARSLDRGIEDFGLRHPAWAKAQAGQELTRKERDIVKRGGYWTWAEAERAASSIEADTSTGRLVLEMPNGERFVPVRAFPARLDEESQRIIREELQGPAGMEAMSQRLWNDRFLTSGDLDKRARNVVLMPAEYAERLDRHLAPAGYIERFFQMLNGAFRISVLTQPRWLTGNFVEPYLVRLPSVGSGAINVFGLAIDMAASGRVLKAMKRSGDPRVRQAATAIEAQQLGGLFVGRRGATVRRTPAEVLPKWVNREYGRVVAKLPVVQTTADALTMVGRALIAPAKGYFVVNRGIERPAQRVALGRSIRKDVQEFSGSWLKSLVLGKKAVEEASRGLTNTPTQRRFMAEQHVLLGKYEGYGPGLRRVIQSIAPFLPWVLNAARFVFWTMPVHRTAQTAFLVKVNDVVSQSWQDVYESTPGGGLRYAVPTENDPLQKLLAKVGLGDATPGGLTDYARYAPWGVATPVAGGDLGNIVNQVAPQLRGLNEALLGRDPFGRPLRMKPTADNPKGEPGVLQKVGIGAYGFAESVLPYVSQGRRLREGGGTPFAGSTIVSPSVKPGTDTGSAVDRVLDPFRPTFLTGRRGRGGGTTRGGGSRGLDGVDLDEIREAIRGASSDLDDVDMDEIREAIRSAGR